MNHASNRGAVELISDPCQMLRLFWIGSVNGAATFVVARCIPNAAFKTDTNGMEATCLHSLTEGFSDSPTVIGNHDGARDIERRRDPWTRFDFDLPTTRASVMRCLLFNWLV